ncbi:hypothetical protein FRC11_011085 [Ceratobasidium sp. 423]|nr:hypothetical protein FRC11_011085 [Ceratobasidium sp. 423]
MSSLSKPKLSVSPGTLTPSAPPTGTHPIHSPTHLEPLPGPSATTTMHGRDQAWEREPRWQAHETKDFANPDPWTPLPPPLKQRKVMVEEVTDVDAPHQEPSPLRYKGLYVEDFPDPLAGSPISNDLVPLPELAAYMHSCGLMADPDHFEVAELLLTSGLSNADKD